MIMELSTNKLSIISEGGARTKGVSSDSGLEGPLISIITVTFNAASTLEQTVRSVIEQSYINVEYIIVDGGSTDATLSLLHQYENEINYWSVKRFGI
jgi:cellulose synthase/poly-beta-1,6-N-acetylglucosamine synthase-like glycosyltransferase